MVFAHEERLAYVEQALREHGIKVVPPNQLGTPKNLG